MKFCSIAHALAAVLLAVGVAHADDAADARAHFAKGNGHYAVGEFEQAGVEYQEAFKLRQDPALLYNAAQAYRLAGTTQSQQKALILYKNYLMFFPQQSNVPSVRKQIAALEEARRAGRTTPPEPAPPPAPEPTPAPAPAPIVKQTPPPNPPSVPETKRAAVAPVTPPAHDASRPLHKKPWLWITVGAAAVVAAGVVTTVVILEDRKPWRTSPDVGPGTAVTALVRW